MSLLQDDIMPNAKQLMREVGRREAAYAYSQRYAEKHLDAWAKSQVESYQPGKQQYVIYFDGATTDALVRLFDLADLSYLCAQVQTALNNAWASFKHEDTKNSVFPRRVIVDHAYESLRSMMSPVICFPARTGCSVE